jgi:NAD(P)-dependent dehydrogenase (short-subunit alcohol dehydrogenase family)
VALAVRSAEDAAACEKLLQRHDGRGLVVRLDYEDPASIRDAAARCAAELDRVDLLVNCGAVNKDPGLPPAASKGPLERLDDAALTTMYRVNVVGPVAACREFLPLLRRSAGGRIANISTIRASLREATDGGSFGYAVTKAALNMATRKLAAQLDPAGIAVVAIDPGWMDTRMGGPEAPTSADTAARDIARILLDDPTIRSGQFIDRYGKPLPW